MNDRDKSVCERWRPHALLSAASLVGCQALAFSVVDEAFAYATHLLRALTDQGSILNDTGHMGIGFGVVWIGHEWSFLRDDKYILASFNSP